MTLIIYIIDIHTHNNKYYALNTIIAVFTMSRIFSIQSAILPHYFINNMISNLLAAAVIQNNLVIISQWEIKSK